MTSLSIWNQSTDLEFSTSCWRSREQNQGRTKKWERLKEMQHGICDCRDGEEEAARKNQEQGERPRA